MKIELDQQELDAILKHLTGENEMRNEAVTGLLAPLVSMLVKPRLVTSEPKPNTATG